MEGPAFRNIGKNIYIFPTVKSALLLLAYAILNALYARGSRFFPLPIIPRALSFFSIIAIFIGIPSGSLCGGERESQSNYLFRYMQRLLVKGNTDT